MTDDVDIMERVPADCIGLEALIDATLDEGDPWRLSENYTDYSGFGGIADELSRAALQERNRRTTDFNVTKPERFQNSRSQGGITDEDALRTQRETMELAPWETMDEREAKQMSLDIEFHGFKPEALLTHGALHLEGCQPNDLQGAVHPIFEHRNFTNLSPEVYAFLLPGLRLASKFLTHDLALGFFADLLHGERVLDPVKTFAQGKKRFRIRSSGPPSAERCRDVRERLYRLGRDHDHVQFVFCTVEELHGIIGCPVYGLCKGEFRKTYQGVYMEDAVRQGHLHRLQTRQSFVGLHEQFWIQARKFMKTTYVDEAARLRFYLFFASNLMHEVSDARRSEELANMVMKTAHHICYLHNFSHQEAHYFLEPFLNNDDEAECGHQWERSIFGGRLGPINEDPSCRWGLSTYAWPPTLEGRPRRRIVYLSVPMSYVQKIQRQDFWDEIALCDGLDADQPGILLAPHSTAHCAISIFSNAVTTMTPAELRKIQNEEQAKIIAALGGPAPLPSPEMHEKFPANPDPLQPTMVNVQPGETTPEIIRRIERERLNNPTWDPLTRPRVRLEDNPGLEPKRRARLEAALVVRWREACEQRLFALLQKRFELEVRQELGNDSPTGSEFDAVDAQLMFAESTLTEATEFDESIRDPGVRAAPFERGEPWWEKAPKEIYKWEMELQQNWVRTSQQKVNQLSLVLETMRSLEEKDAQQVADIKRFEERLDRALIDREMAVIHLKRLQSVNSVDELRIQIRAGRAEQQASERRRDEGLDPSGEAIQILLERQKAPKPAMKQRPGTRAVGDPWASPVRRTRSRSPGRTPTQARQRSPLGGSRSQRRRPGQTGRNAERDAEIEEREIMLRRKNTDTPAARRRREELQRRQQEGQEQWERLAGNTVDQDVRARERRNVSQTSVEQDSHRGAASTEAMRPLDELAHRATTTRPSRSSHDSEIHVRRSIHIQPGRPLVGAQASWPRLSSALISPTSEGSATRHSFSGHSEPRPTAVRETERVTQEQPEEPHQKQQQEETEAEAASGTARAVEEEQNLTELDLMLLGET